MKRGKRENKTMDTHARLYTCDKRSYQTKAKAKQFVRTSKSGCVRVYKCKDCGLFHATSISSETAKSIKDQMHKTKLRLQQEPS
jgi:Zn-finger protein